MPKYYFTYSTTGHPYIGGWTEIEAPNKMCASLLHDLLHGEGNYESLYEERFFRKFLVAGKRLGYGCHERITYERTGMYDIPKKEKVKRTRSDAK